MKTFSFKHNNVSSELVSQLVTKSFKLIIKFLMIKTSTTNVTIMMTVMVKTVIIIIILFPLSSLCVSPG